MYKSICFGILICISSIPALSAENDSLSSMDFGQELYGPVSRFSVEVNPIGLVIGLAKSKKSRPSPITLFLTRLRLFSSAVGIQGGPILVSGYHGGYGFSVGPSIYPNEAMQLNWQFTPTFLWVKVNGFNPQSGGFLEATRYFKKKYAQLGVGGITGIAPGEIVGTSEKPLEIKKTFLIGVTLSLGLAFPE